MSENQKNEIVLTVTGAPTAMKVVSATHTVVDEKGKILYGK